jgi:hypothetical protein
MAIVLYMMHKEKAGDDFLRIINHEIPEHTIEIYSSLTALSKRLRRPMLDVSVAVLYASNRAELMELLYLKDLLSELEVVLVLPGGQPDMLDKAHLLHPRFIVETENDFKQLGRVLRKMTDRYDKKYGNRVNE